MTFLRSLSFKNISVKRIAILGMLLALFIAVKYAFAFVPGIEGVSFLFITCALFLPFVDLVLLLISFNFLVLTTTGFGTWWIAYWVLWPAIALGAKLLSKVTRSRYVFSLFGFASGLSVMFVYFFSDMIFFDKSFAILNLITAAPINVIEGLTTMSLIILLTPRILRVVAGIGGTFWERDKFYTFKENKHSLLNIVISTVMVLGAIASVVVLFIFNSAFFKFKEQVSRQNRSIGYTNGQKVPDGWYALSNNQYNTLYDSLNDNQVGVVVLANGKYTTEVVDIYNSETLEEVISHLKTFRFSLHDTYLGKFVGSYFMQGQSLHGTSSSKNYGDYYPMIMLDHAYSDFGISSTHVQSKDIIEFTYDHNA